MLSHDAGSMQMNEAAYLDVDMRPARPKLSTPRVDKFQAKARFPYLSRQLIQRTARARRLLRDTRKGVSAKMNDKTKPTDDTPLAALAAELDACRKAVDFCFKLAMGPQTGVRNPKAFFETFTEIREIPDRFRLMDMAIELMRASGTLAEAIGKMHGGAMRQSITVDRYEHGIAAGPRDPNLSMRERRRGLENARALQLQGEGEGPEK